MISKEFFATTNNKAPHKMEAMQFCKLNQTTNFFLDECELQNVNAPNSALKEGTETQ